MLGTLLSHSSQRHHHARPAFPTRRSSDLAPGSPAIDAGANPDAFVFDQRGFPHHRVVGAHADIGAYEFESDPSIFEIGRDTSELQSHVNIVCRLLLEKIKAISCKTKTRMT